MDQRPPQGSIRLLRPLLGANAHHSVPTPTRLRYPPFASSTHHSNPASFAIRAVFDVKIVVFDNPATTTGLHSALMPTTRLQHPSLGCNTHHLALTPTICLRHPTTQLQRPPLRSDTQYFSGTHHSAPMPTTGLRHQPVDSSTDYLPPALTTQLQKHSQSAELLCLTDPENTTGIHSVLMNHSAPMPTTLL